MSSLVGFAHKQGALPAYLAPRWTAVFLLALIVAAYFGAYPIFVMKVMCFGIFAMAFNFLLGYVGLMSFGHALFFGGAAYVTAHAAKVWGVGPELAMLLGVGFAVLSGGFVGFLAIRRSGLYFGMVTLAMAQLFYFLCVEMPFTLGEDGIQDVPRGRLLGLLDLESTGAMYLLVSALFVLAIWIMWRIVNSPFGQILKAIRENEARAVSLGYRVERYKLAAFVISSAFAGLAGSLKALLFQLASLTDVSWGISGDIMVMTLLGGVGTLFGPLVGATLVITLETYVATSNIPVPVMLGVIFVLCVMVFRRGILGELMRLLAK